MTAEQISALEQLAFQIISGAVQAAPIIIADVQASMPYVQAIMDLARAGGVPTADMFASVRARLDAGSAIIWQKATAAQAQIDQFPLVGASA